MVKQISVLGPVAHKFIMTLGYPGVTIYPNQIHEALRKEPINVSMKLVTNTNAETDWVFEFETEEDYTYFKLRWG